MNRLFAPCLLAFALVACGSTTVHSDLDAAKAYENYSFSTEVLVASVRNPTHVVDAALLGADICTIPFSVMIQLAKHPLTDVGLKKFVEDAKKIPR